MPQVLIYQALGFQEPTFGHVSLILAPDKSKLSKRHGATSVGEFREQGFLPEAMINYLSLLGWNDGTEQVSLAPTSQHRALPPSLGATWLRLVQDTGNGVSHAKSAAASDAVGLDTVVLLASFLKHSSFVKTGIILDFPASHNQ